jgi:type I restriction enzyme M protein
MTTESLFTFHIADILKDSNYSLKQFDESEIESFNAAIIAKELKNKQTPYIKCIVRNKEIKLTPEEIVRQLFVRKLIQHYHYPVERMTLEFPVNFGREVKRADIVIFDKDRPNVPYIMIEIKKPKLKEGKEQLRSYCNATGAPIGVWSNGGSISYYHRKDPNYFEDITDIPSANQKLSDILNERFTIDDLVAKDKLVNEKKSLKDLILEMEDEVLANAGVDVFEEVFKLTFTKLYDEWLSGRQRDRVLEFRNTGQTETELSKKFNRFLTGRRVNGKACLAKTLPFILRHRI